jgi:hypothetical protein
LLEDGGREGGRRGGKLKVRGKKGWGRDAREVTEQQYILAFAVCTSHALLVHATLIKKYHEGRHPHPHPHQYSVK